jgi:Mrp family chromosome partitioning ATPase/capsular polysaccharide biosynthesis protein
MATERVEPSYYPSPEPGEAELQTTEYAAHEHSDIREFLTLLRRHALLITAVALVTAGATFAVSVRQQKVYSGSTMLLYTPSTSTGTDVDPTRTISTIVGISTSNSVLAPIATRFHLSLPQLKNDVSVTGDSTANLVKIAAKSPSPAVSATLTNAIAAALIDYRATHLKNLLDAQITFLQQQLQTFAGKTDPSAVAAASDVRTQLVEAQSQLATATSDLSVLTPAVVPTSPSAPHPMRDAVIGLLVGLVLGIMLAVVRDRLDRRTRAVDEVEALYRAPTLGMVPFTKRRVARDELLADFSGAGALADSFRTIRTNLSLFRLSNAENSVIVVTSAIAAEGKSFVAANLAHSLSVMGKQVLVVSADLHNPTLHDYFGLAASENGASSLLQRVEFARGNTAARPPAGLVQVLAGEVPLAEAARVVPLSPRERASGGSLAVLANSSTFFDPAVLFGSGPMTRFLQQAKQRYDIIILDTPPLLVNADAALLAQEADVLVLVARLNHLTKNQARRAVRVMAATHIVPTGLIVTGELDEPGYGYGYRYGGDESTPEADSTEERRAHTTY